MPASWALWPHLGPDPAQPFSTHPGEGQRRLSGSGAQHAVESPQPAVISARNPSLAGFIDFERWLPLTEQFLHTCSFS